MAEIVYDSIIVGGGPAGLTAAIYLARFNRKVLVVDRGHGGRWQTHEINENFFGFPEGIHTVKLRELGRKQAARFGAEFSDEEVSNIHHHEDGTFHVHGPHKEYVSKTIILATGVSDYFPHFQHEPDYLGRSLFWCITCDGHKTIDRKVLIIGNNDEAACTCLQFLIYTKNLVFVTNAKKGQIKLSKLWQGRLKKYHIPLLEGCIKEVVGEKGMVEKVVLDSKEEIVTDFLFSLQGSTPHTHLAKHLGVKLNKLGYIKSDLEQRTNVPGVYAAGDVTQYFSHQIASAVHEGSMAGQAVNYDLYSPDQREG